MSMTAVRTNSGGQGPDRNPLVRKAMPPTSTARPTKVQASAGASVTDAQARAVYAQPNSRCSESQDPSSLAPQPARRPNTAAAIIDRNRADRPEEGHSVARVG